MPKRYPPEFGRGDQRMISGNASILNHPSPRLQARRARSGRLSGRCRACRFLAMCGGGLASRALATTGSLAASDPACHLTDAEIGVAA